MLKKREEQESVRQGQSLQRFLNKALVTVLIVISCANLFTPFFFARSTRNVALLNFYEVHLTVVRLLSFMLVILAWRLAKRSSAAWSVSMVVLLLLCIQKALVMRGWRDMDGWLVLLVAVFITLLATRSYYCRRTVQPSWSKGLVVLGIFLVFVFGNAVITVSRTGAHDVRTFEGAVAQTVSIMFNADYLVKPFAGIHPQGYAFVFWFSWACVLMGLCFFLVPPLSRQQRERQGVERARELVLRYGENCSSYLLLEHDKRRFFGLNVDGVIGFGVVGDAVVVLGDPVCAPEDYAEMVREFTAFCEARAYDIIFMNVRSPHEKTFRTLGYGVTKCGEEPLIKLADYSLAGKTMSKVRLNINHANREGIEVREYKPLEARDTQLENTIEEVSRSWLSEKKSGELVFSMGTIGFDEPLDRRYFYAVDAEGIVQGFSVFMPFDHGDAYVADVTRHRAGAVRGTMEKIFYTACETFRDEGVTWMSLALAPLARLDDERDPAARLLNAVYEKANKVYGFKALYQTKEKYGPTEWVPAYYCYRPRVFSPSMAYAVVRIQNPAGILDYIKGFLRR